MLSRPATRLVAAALLLGALNGCNPYVWSGAAALTVPNATTGRNIFHHADAFFGPRCSETSYFDRPVRCVNDPD